MQRSLQRLSSLGFEPRGIVDVGAWRGDWTREALQTFPAAHVLMFEARPSMREALEQLATWSGGRAAFELSLLGARDSEATAFYEVQTGEGTGSSVLPELSDAPRHKLELPMRRLDACVQRLLAKTSAIDLLKLDVQGYELEVLEGGQDVLRGCEVVVTEVALLPYNAGAPLIDCVLPYLAERDMMLFDVATLMRDASGRVTQADLVFVRKDSALRASV